jgi:hypothetical protein
MTKIKIMRSLFFLTAIIILTACANQKEIVNSENHGDQVVENVEDGFTVGMVRITDKGCFCYLEVNENGALLKMYPVNLDEKYKKEGIRLKFTYNVSRAMQPENCFVDKVVALENVVELK